MRLPGKRYLTKRAHAFLQNGDTSKANRESTRGDVIEGSLAHQIVEGRAHLNVSPQAETHGTPVALSRAEALNHVALRRCNKKRTPASQLPKCSPFAYILRNLERVQSRYHLYNSARVDTLAIMGCGMLTWALTSVAVCSH